MLKRDIKPLLIHFANDTKIGGAVKNEEANLLLQSNVTTS